MTSLAYSCLAQASDHHADLDVRVGGRLELLLRSPESTPTWGMPNMTSHELRPEGATNEQISEIPDRRTHRTWNDVPVGMSSDRGGSGKAVLYSQARGYVGGTPCRVDSIRLDPRRHLRGGGSHLGRDRGNWGPGHAKGAGRAYVFSHTSAGCAQVAELKGSDVVANDNFGSAVAIAGRTIAIGAPNHASEAGRVYVFTKTGTGWRQTAELKGSDTVAGDSFGTAVGIAGYKHRGWITEPSSECRPSVCLQ